MKSYSSRELISLINADGWYLARTVGDHHHFRHPEKPGVVTIPHPKKDVPIKINMFTLPFLIMRKMVLVYHFRIYPDV